MASKQVTVGSLVLSSGVHGSITVSPEQAVSETVAEA